MCVDDEKLEARDVATDDGVFRPTRLPAPDCRQDGTTTCKHGRQSVSFWANKGGALDNVRLALVVRNQFIATPNLGRIETSVARIGCDCSRHGF
jgi:hypothetical protein